MATLKKKGAVVKENKKREPSRKPFPHKSNKKSTPQKMKRGRQPANQALKVAQFFTKKKQSGEDDTSTFTDAMSLVSPAGDSNSGLSMFVLQHAEDTGTHLASVRQFAAYMICSMYLAGLDRAYGGVHTEVARLMAATQESSRNTVIDFSLIKNMLGTPISSIASFEMGRPDHGVNELELASELAYVLDAGFAKFLFGKDRKKAAAAAAAAAAFGEEPFEVRVGATDPNESAHEFAGKARVTKTPSVHTYLALTLLDPYAYGISEKRAVLTFLVSVMQRAILRNTKPDAFEDRSAKDEIDAEIDSSVVLSSLSQNSLVEGDAEDASIIRAEIQKLPTFKKFVRCMREHSADAAHTSNPSFHALYTLLKGTYLVHFASYYLSMAVNTVLREEMNTDPKLPARRPDKKCVLSRAVLSSIEGSARELARLVDRFGAGTATDRLDTQDLRRQIMKANIAVCELQDRCAYTHEGKSVTLDRLITKGSFVTVGGTATALLSGMEHGALALLLLGPGGGVGPAAAAAPRTTTTFPLYTRSSQIFDRDAMHGAAHDVGDEYSDEELCEIGKLHVAFMMFLVTRSTSDFYGEDDEDEASPEERMRRVRFFRFRPIVLFLSRLYAFFYRSYTSLVQPKKEQPVIVTMLVGAGWKRSVQRENEAERMQKMFSSFTRVMSNMLLFCHHVKGDLYRGPIVMKQLRKLYFANLALMSVTQQKLLKTVPSCHPFHSGTKTQLTLPTAVAVKMIPTEFVLPPNYSVASLNDRTYHKDEDREAARKAAIGNARVLAGRKGAGELRAMQGADHVVNYIAATGAAGPREATKAHEHAVGIAPAAGAAPLKIDPAAFMRALSAAR